MEYLDYLDHPKFPASAPLEHPHIITTGDFSELGSCFIPFCDAIATLLYHLEAKQPGVLDDFFSPDLQYFKLMRIAGTSCEMNLFLFREGSQVIAGYYNDYSSQGLIEWDCLCYSTISDNGSWRTTLAAVSAYSISPIERVIHKNIHINSFTGLGPSSDKAKRDVARMVADAVMNRSQWEGTDETTFDFEIVMKGKANSHNNKKNKKDGDEDQNQEKDKNKEKNKEVKGG